LGLLLLAAMMSHNQLDPSPLNLLWPDEGIHNWLGLPGALASGFLVEVFGWCGYLVPLFLLLLGHKKTIRLWQAIFLDIAVIILLTIGIAQVIDASDAYVARITGYLGVISSVQLAHFPGKLITILLAAGFIVRYSKHFLLNLHFILMLQQLGALLLVVMAELERFGKKKLGKLDGRIKERFSPLSIASKQRMTSMKRRVAQNWSTLNKSVASRLLEVSPFHRLPLEKKGEQVIGPITDEITQELGRRQRLQKTLAEFEKRYISETI
jgi:hypothetical protein